MIRHVAKPLAPGRSHVVMILCRHVVCGVSSQPSKFLNPPPPPAAVSASSLHGYYYEPPIQHYERVMDENLVQL